MDLLTVLRTLWRRKLLIVLAALLGAAAGILSAFSLSLSPLKLESRGVSYGVASTALIVDLDPSPITSNAPELTPLVQRAKIFAAILSGDAIRSDVARRLGVDPDDVAISAIGPGTSGDVTGVVRGVQLERQDADLRAVVQADLDTTLISVSTQAPTGAEAVALADAITAAGRRYAADAVRRPRDTDVVLRPLGRATGGDVNPGADLQAAIVIGGLAFGLLVIGFLFLARVLGDLRTGRRLARRPAAETDSSS